MRTVAPTSPCWVTLSTTWPRIEPFWAARGVARTDRNARMGPTCRFRSIDVTSAGGSADQRNDGYCIRIAARSSPCQGQGFVDEQRLFCMKERPDEVGFGKESRT